MLEHNSAVGNCSQTRSLVVQEKPSFQNIKRTIAHCVMLCYIPSIYKYTHKKYEQNV